MQSDPLNDAYCSPNTILKLFQLSNPALDQFYNVILFDESQDANPVTIDIVLRNNCCKVFVGDQHQVINRWRGAENALEIVEDHGAQVMRLTKSFRFGPLVAALANVVLSMKGETFPLVGWVVLMLSLSHRRYRIKTFTPSSAAPTWESYNLPTSRLCGANG